MKLTVVTYDVTYLMRLTLDTGVLKKDSFQNSQTCVPIYDIKLFTLTRVQIL